MYNHLKNFIKGFLTRSGSSVFIAMFSARILSFFASWLALQLVNEKDLGLVIYAYSFLIFIIPIGGFGLNQGYLRYASIYKDQTIKDNLFIYTLKRGLGISILFSFTLILLSYLFIKNQQLKLYFTILSMSLVSFYLFELFKTHYRISHKNILFARLEITYYVILVFLVGILGYFFHALGYSIAIILAPILATLFFIIKIDLKLSNYIKPNIVNASFWRYGFFAGMANVATQLLYAIDLILIGYLLHNSELVTHFKYVSLIPYSLLFIPSMFLTTDFVKITEEIDQKNNTKKYIKSYQSFFILISIGVIFIAIVFPKLILSLFSKNLIDYVLTFRILMFGVVGILIFRGLFGNLLSSIGKAHLNFWIAMGSLVFNLILNFIFIPKYGLNGAAITSATIMWVTGILSYILFNVYYKKTTSNS